MRRTNPFPNVSTLPRLLLALLYSVTFAIVGSGLSREWGFPLDDSYIYQTLARSLAAASSSPPYFPSQPLAGATSLLWLGLQTAHWRLIPKQDPILFNLLFSWLLLLILGQMLWSFAERDGMQETTRWLLAGTPALCGNLVWLGLIGMEPLLFLVLSLLSILLWCQPSSEAGWLAGVAAGVLISVRPEAGLLGILLLLAGRIAGRPAKDALKFAIPWLACALLFIGCNRIATGSAFPSTLKGREWLWFRHTRGPHSLQAIGGFLGQWIRRLPQLISLHFANMQIRLTRADSAFTTVAVLLVLLLLAGAYSLYHEGGPRVRLLLIWVFLHTATYLVLLPVPGQGGRYQPGLLLLAFPLLFSGILLLLRRLPRRSLSLSQPFRSAVLAAAVLAGGISSLLTWRTVSLLSIAHIQATHGAMARWIQLHLPADARIATFDSGYIAYVLDRPVTDLGGLMDRHYLPYLESGTVRAYLGQNQISYVILPQAEKPRDDLHLLEGAKTQPLAEFCSDRQPWAIAYAFTQNAWRCQKLYRLLP